MLGFELTTWDYLTFAAMAAAGAAVLGIIIWLAGLPGRIAIARKHPEAEAVQWMGWAGLFPTVLPWVQAFIWAFKPTDVVDIRRFPSEVARATEDEISRLKGQPKTENNKGGPPAEKPAAGAADLPVESPDKN